MDNKPAIKAFLENKKELSDDALKSIMAKIIKRLGLKTKTEAINRKLKGKVFVESSISILGTDNFVGLSFTGDQVMYVLVKMVRYDGQKRAYCLYGGRNRIIISHHVVDRFMLRAKKKYSYEKAVKSIIRAIVENDISLVGGRAAIHCKEGILAGSVTKHGGDMYVLMRTFMGELRGDYKFHEVLAKMIRKNSYFPDEEAEEMIGILEKSKSMARDETELEYINEALEIMRDGTIQEYK